MKFPNSRDIFTNAHLVLENFLADNKKILTLKHVTNSNGLLPNGTNAALCSLSVCFGGIINVVSRSRGIPAGWASGGGNCFCCGCCRWPIGCGGCWFVWSIFCCGFRIVLTAAAVVESVCWTANSGGASPCKVKSN